MNLLNNFLFAALPYAAIAVFLVGSIYRYRARGFTYSSLSAQFLEGGGAYLPSMLFHWGILVVLLGHLLVFLFPDLSIAWHANTTRLIVDEVVLLSFGIGAGIGLALLLIRRLTNARIWVVTSPMDIAIVVLLLLQIAFGLWIALGSRWGYYWFATDLTPYLWSILKLSPSVDVIGAMPTAIKLHVAGAFVILAVLPFTRLVHFLVAPLHYTWRSYQRVIWYWDRKRVGAATTAWTTTPPRNN